MNKYLFVLGFVLVGATSHASDNQVLTCTEVKAIESTQTVSSTVTIVVEERSSDLPMRATVDNLPEGSGLNMNYQDIFGLGSEPDGDVFFAPKDEGDGMIQDECGDDSYSALIEVRKSGTLYCGKCVAQ